MDSEKGDVKIRLYDHRSIHWLRGERIPESEREILALSQRLARAPLYVANGEVNAYELQVIDTNDFRNWLTREAA